MPHDVIPAALLSKPKTALVADLFCGAGGSSTGAKRALAGLGYQMILTAVNHWNVAIETHSANHPEARHYVDDVTRADPIKLVPEGKLDLLMASPTCTYHSRARGGKPTSDQQRMDPWAVVRWCSELRVKRLLVENVPEFVDWGPIDTRNGKPIKSRKGEYFRAWVAALRALGGWVEWRTLNAANYGDATTRVRFFLMARFDGKKNPWPEPTHSREGADLLGVAVRKWRAARDIIDWSIDGQSIFDRKRPLARATLERIYAGARKFRWPEPYLVILRQHMDAQSVDGPVPSICTGGDRGGGHIALAQPFLLNRHGDNGSTRGHSLEDPMPTADCRGAGYLIEPVEPFVFPMQQSTGRLRGHRSVDASLPTITASSNDIGLVVPFVANLAHTGADESGCRPISEPLHTLHAGGGSHALVVPMRNGMEPCESADPLPSLTTKSQIGLAEPFLVVAAHGTAPGDTHDRRCRSVDDPLQTITAGGGQFGIAEPFVLSQASGGAPRGVSEPMPTITTGGNGGAHALIAPYYGSGSGETCTSDESPLPTVTTKARFGIVVPVTNKNGGPGPRSIDEPVPTMTTAKGGEFALAMPVTHGRDAGRVRSVDDPLPTVTGAHRGELAVIVAAFGERKGQAPRFHSVEEPAPTICADGRIQLAEAAPQWDIRFRMLQPHELAAAMGFSDDDQAYEFRGTKTQVTKMIGNAVPVNTATALVSALMSK